MAIKLPEAELDDAELDETGLEEPIPDESSRSIAFALVLLAIAVWFLFGSMNIGTSAAVWPRILSISLIILAVLRIGMSLLARVGASNEGTVAAVPERGLQLRLGHKGRRRLFSTTWLLAYCIAAPFAGFGITMLVFLPVYMWVSGFRRPVAIAAITITTAICLTLLFDTVVGVSVWEAGY